MAQLEEMNRYQTNLMILRVLKNIGVALLLGFMIVVEYKNCSVTTNKFQIANNLERTKFQPWN